MLRWALTAVFILAVCIFFNSKENRDMAKKVARAYWKATAIAFAVVVAFFTLTAILQ